jgi:hypothetical protein
MSSLAAMFGNNLNLLIYIGMQGYRYLTRQF